MIDIFNQVFTAVAAPVREAFPGIKVTGEYAAVPSSYPAVAIDEIENIEVESDSAGRERYNRVRYRCQVFSNKIPGKRAEAREIQSVIDGVLRQLGFRRVSYSPTPDVIDNTVYCITTVFSATISDDGWVHGTTR